LTLNDGHIAAPNSHYQLYETSAEREDEYKTLLLNEHHELNKTKNEKIKKFFRSTEKCSKLLPYWVEKERM